MRNRALIGILVGALVIGAIVVVFVVSREGSHDQAHHHRTKVADATPRRGSAAASSNATQAARAPRGRRARVASSAATTQQSSAGASTLDVAEWAMDPATQPASQPSGEASGHSLFDPKLDIPVSEVHAGMTGYGLSVFSGTKIDRFNVKVISVLKDFNPKFDVILVSCSGANLEHTGSIEGMSGSPIYLRDDQGRDRLAGAFAYGWPLMKDPVGGVQPIQYMLQIPDNAPMPTTRDSGVTSGHSRWSLLELKPFLHNGARAFDAAGPLGKFSYQASGRVGNYDAGGAPRLQPLATPLMTAGIPTSVIDALGPQLAAAGLVPMQAGAAVKGSNDPNSPAPKIEPGSALVVPLVTGDAEMSAIGTCTTVIGNRVFGFGHSFNNEGPISLPMGTGYINTVIANLNTSFKIGALSNITGTLLADETVGVAGQMGRMPVMTPMEIRLHYVDGSEDQVYHFNIARHPKLTPLIAAAAMAAAVSGTRNLPEYQTIDYDLHLKFANGQELHLVNRVVNAALPQLVSEISLPLQAAADNPFARVALTSLTGTFNVTPKAMESSIRSVNLPRLKYQPGDTAKIFVSYLPFRGTEEVLPIEFQIPRDLPDGTYPLVITDWQNYIQNEAQTHPFRFQAESIGDVFAVMKDVLPLKHNALYVQLLQQPDGLAIGRTAMSHLPSSRRQEFLLAGLSDTTPFYTSTLKIVPTQTVMNGQAAFQITVAREAKVESAAPAGGHAKPAHPAAKPAAVPAPAPAAPGVKSEQPKEQPKGEPKE